MRVEREIEGFAIPFTAGILAAAIPKWPSFHQNPVPYILPSAILGITLTILLLPLRHRFQSISFQILTLSAAFFCGMTTGLTGVVLEASNISADGLLKGLGLDTAKMVKSIIDSLPFEKSSTNALIKALLTGDRGNIPQNITNSFRTSGASHILALSGLHLGIIYGIIQKSLSIIGNSPAAKKSRSILTIIICSCYTLATGAGPSIVRALIFITVNEITRLGCRHSSLVQTLYISLIVQLTISPLSIRSAGFQLSYAAMAGIAFIYPWINNLWSVNSTRRWNPMKWLWNSATLSISCQLTTAPLAWYYFDSIPSYFIITNLIALPLTSLLIPLALALTILHGIGIHPETLTKATEVIVDTLTAALDIISSI